MTDLDDGVLVLRRSTPATVRDTMARFQARLQVPGLAPGEVAVRLAQAAATVLPVSLVLLADGGSAPGLREVAAQVHPDPSRADALADLALADPQLSRLLAAVLRTGRGFGPLPAGTSPAAALTGVESVLVLPLRAGRCQHGVLLAGTLRGGHPPSAAQAELLRLLADRAAEGLQVAIAAAGMGVDAETALASVPDAVVCLDESSRICVWNAGAERSYGVPAAHALGRDVREVIVASTYSGTDEQAALAQVRAAGRWVGRVHQVSVSGAQVHMDSRVCLRRGPDGSVHGLVAVNRDVTDTVLAESAALLDSRFARELMEALDGRAAILDSEGRVMAANGLWRSAVHERDRCVCGPVPTGESWVEALRQASGPAVADFAGQVSLVLARNGGQARFECQCLAAGAERATAIEVVPLQGQGRGAVVVQSDVSWRRHLQDELQHRATHDELTGLPNRAQLMDRLRTSVAALDGQQKLAVLFCDLDGFKDINDGLGHAVGDQVLIAVARRLRQRCRSADIVARFGGDEFVIVLPVTDTDQAVAMADRLVEVLSEPISVGDAEVAPGASIGITVVDRPPEGDDPVDALLRDADTAMYHAKERGRGRFEFFDSRLRENISERLELAAALRRAGGDGQLRLCYQTRRNCGDRQVAGVEALLRWDHPNGPVSPAVFIPIAERTGRIVEVGGWALRQALSEVSEVSDRRLTVAVNVSPRQLSAPNFVQTVDQALASSGLEPWRLVLEITEGALVDDPAAARSVLGDLRRLGVTIALDDFGTGWSSMSYLRTLPVDAIKIDKSFVADLPTDPDACAVVSAVLGLGHGMGLIVVAEGVEMEDQLDVLRDMGCDEYQGFIDGRPGPLREVLAVEP